MKGGMTAEEAADGRKAQKRNRDHDRDVGQHKNLEELARTVR